MHKLLYVSATGRNAAPDMLKDILASSRANNARLGVTGLLLYLDGGFLQVLEGERDAIKALYAVIEKDPRHWEARLLMDEPAERNFGAWSMGFHKLDESSDPGMVDIAQSAIQGLIRPGGAKPMLDILIRTFRDVHGAG